MIPFSRPTIGDDEINAVINVLKSGWLTVGSRVHEFEENIKAYTGLENVVAVDSCTSALTLAANFYSSIIGTEYPVVVFPALTFVATVNPFIHAGFKIKFVDVDYTGNMDISNIVSGLHQLVVPVHFAGQLCDMSSLLEKHPKVMVIEDAAHAMGLFKDNKHVGSETFGACVSFYPTKNMTTIEGGAILTNYKSLADVSRELSLHGLGSSHIDRYERSSVNKPIVTFPGFKANMTDVEAAIGIEQLKKLDYFKLIRTRIVNEYLAQLPNSIRTLDVRNNHVWHMFVILVENRDEFVAKAREKGVAMGIHYSPIIPAHPYYTKLTGYKRGQFPVAEYIADHCVSLPLYPSMTEKDIEKVVSVVKELV